MDRLDDGPNRQRSCMDRASALSPRFFGRALFQHQVWRDPDGDSNHLPGGCRCNSTWLAQAGGGRCAAGDCCGTDNGCHNPSPIFRVIAGFPHTFAPVGWEIDLYH